MKVLSVFNKKEKKIFQIITLYEIMHDRLKKKPSKLHCKNN